MCEAVSLPVQESERARRRGPVSPPPTSVPSEPAVAVIDLYLLWCARATGAVRIMHMHRSYNGMKLRMGLLCLLSPQRFDTVITVHLEEKPRLQMLSCPSICGAHSVPGLIL